MSDEMITGKIYFLRVPFGREYEDFIAFLVRCAVDNQIWINTGEQIRNPDARYKYSIDNSESNDLAEKYLPFEITDAKDTDECNRIMRGMWYRDTDFGIADWGNSGIPNIENFLVQIMEHDLIGYVQISIDLAHGYTPSAYANLDINASDFCKILMSLPNHNAVPTAQFNIRKSGDQPMIYHIVRFDKSRTEDYLRIFDRDNSGSVVCYCTQWNMTQEEIDRRIIEPVKNNVAPLSQISREVAVEMIHADKIHGYIAYEGKDPVGWCNCDDKRNYKFLARHVSVGSEKERIKSIVCLKVVGEKDYFEVGSELLKSVCRMSKAEGYSFIEVYPHEGAMICTDFDSAMQLYRANGFKSFSEKNGEAVLRKEL